MFLVYMVVGVVWSITITIIGVPLGLANFKLIPASLFRLGKDVVSVEGAGAAFANGTAFGTRV